MPKGYSLIDGVWVARRPPPREFQPVKLPDPAVVHPVIMQVVLRQNALKINTVKLARKAGINPHVIENWRRGTYPQLRNLLYVCEVLGLDLTTVVREKRDA